MFKQILLVTSVVHIFIFFLLTTQVEGRRKPMHVTVNTCTPPPNAKMPQYIIGYGSLMSSSSKQSTYPNTGENIPILVKNFQRAWNCKGDTSSLSTTYLGVLATPKASFNGALFSLTKNQSAEDESRALADFDRRESFYCRQEVGIKGFDFMGKIENLNISGQFWIYVTKKEFTAGPSKEYPIVQSYLDTWLNGCLELEKKYKLKEFSKKCVESTDNWSENWENDRLYKRRPFVYQKNALAIDKLLNSTVHWEFIKMSSKGGKMGYFGLQLFLFIFVKILL